MSLCEATGDTYDAEFRSGAQVIQTGPGGRTGRLRKKTTPERRRVKAVGGGKTEPVDYKPRKDIGTQRKTETRVQQPEKERGSKEVAQSYAEKVKAERRKAAQARAAAKKGGATETETKPSAKEASKTASKLLRKKAEPKAPAPGYTPPKASGLSTKERLHVTRKGEQKLRDLVLQSTGKKSEKELKHRYTSR